MYHCRRSSGWRCSRTARSPRTWRTGSPPASAADARAGWVVQRFLRDAAADPHAEDVDLDRRLDGARRGDVRVGDGAADRIAVAAARHATDDIAFDAHRLGAERDRPWVVEDQARELREGGRFLALEERL